MKTTSKAKSIGKADQMNHSHLNDLSHLANAILSSAGVGIYIVQHGQFVYVSQLYLKLTGYTEEELIGQYSLDNIYHEDREMVREKAIKCLKAERHEPYEYRFVNKKNEIMWVLETITPIVYKGERASLGSFMDITGRKRTEDALQRSEENYRLLFESAGQGILIAKGNKIQFANTALTEISGYSKETMTSRPFTSFIHPDDRSIVLKRHLMRLKGKIPQANYYFKILTANGAIKWLQINSRRISWDGEPATLSFITDITEHKRAEENLRQSEENYRNIFENAQEGIYRTTPEGKFIMANKAMARILAYDSPRELMDGISDINRQLYVNPENRIKVMKLIEEQGFAKDDELEFYRRDGQKIWVSRNMRGIRDEKGQLLFLEGLVEDITDRKNSLDQLRKALGGTVRAIAMLVETRDPYTAGHQRRVADLARAIAREMNLSNDQINGLRIAGMIHDIGKISVPSEILSSPRKLKALELSMIKIHTQSGYDILKEIDFPWPVARMVLEHHERIDGSGYPNGLTGNHILLESRILAVADVVEAIATHRPYRPALGLDAAFDEIISNRGVLYDPDTVDACLRLFLEQGYIIKE
jgi:PAS domain S-box-containing protein/putative nucleotidyltransferase with HDIG domain